MSKVRDLVSHIIFFSSLLSFFFLLVFILDLQISFSALLAVPPKSFARSCDLRISSFSGIEAVDFRVFTHAYLINRPFHGFFQLFTQTSQGKSVETTGKSVLKLIKLPNLKVIGLNPLSPKSDQHQISPCNINALYNRVVMRIRDMITQDEFA